MGEIGNFDFLSFWSEVREKVDRITFRTFHEGESCTIFIGDFIFQKALEGGKGGERERVEKMEGVFRW